MYVLFILFMYFILAAPIAWGERHMAGLYSFTAASKVSSFSLEDLFQSEMDQSKYQRTTLSVSLVYILMYFSIILRNTQFWGV